MSTLSPSAPISRTSLTGAYRRAIRVIMRSRDGVKPLGKLRRASVLMPRWRGQLDDPFCLRDGRRALRRRVAGTSNIHLAKARWGASFASEAAW